MSNGDGILPGHRLRARGAASNRAGRFESAGREAYDDGWDLPEEERSRDKATDWRKLSIPIHHLESVCVFGASAVSPPA